MEASHSLRAPGCGRRGAGQLAPTKGGVMVEPLHDSRDMPRLPQAHPREEPKTQGTCQVDRAAATLST